MTTKKQKRIAGEARAHEEASARRLSGLIAQKKTRQEQAKKELEEWAEQHESKHSWKKRIKECPHCRHELNTIIKTKTTESENI